MSKIKSIFCKLCSFKQINVEICSPPPKKKYFKFGKNASVTMQQTWQLANTFISFLRLETLRVHNSQIRCWFVP